MQKLTSFFLLASGADPALLKQCPTDRSKYAGIGATIFFTGLFAALAAGYALFTVFNSYWIAAALGLIWGLMIFNLDRYIVSSMRKNASFRKEFITAAPRLILAVVIAMVIAKPLELKLFEKEIEPELVVMEQQVYNRQEAETRLRFDPVREQLRQDIVRLQEEIHTKSRQRDALVQLAQEEADGTGGSKQKNLGPIYKLKKADAEKADAELQELVRTNTGKITELENQVAGLEAGMRAEISSLTRSKIDGPAARLEALSRLTEQSPAMWWANVFIILLFIIIESAPVLVKMMSSAGPYDHLLRNTEHTFLSQSVESMATVSSETKMRTETLGETEKAWVKRKLDAELI
jgi:hypothetical protein